MGRINVGGEIDTYGLASNPFAIAPGTDGNAWFTEVAGKDRPDYAVGRDYGIPLSKRQLSVRTHGRGRRKRLVRGPRHNMIGRVKTAHANTAYVLSFDGGFSPKTVEAAQGDSVQWTFFGPSLHQAADRSGLGLFDSGPKSLVSSYSATFTAAGIYRYVDPLQEPNVDATGKVSVPVLVAPSKGTPTTTLGLRGLQRHRPSGFVFDVQILRPGATGYASWRTDTTDTSASFVPDAGIGTYKFRARLREATTGKATEYSPWHKITVV